MRIPRLRPRLRLPAVLLLVPLLAGCFVAAPGDPYGDADGTGSGGGARLRVALAFPPAENYSPYGMDAYDLSRLGVVEGLTRLDANGTAVAALAESWYAEGNGRDWLFALREATFHDGTEVTAAAVADSLTRAALAEPPPGALSGIRLTAEAAGDRLVRVSTEEPDPVLPLRLSNPSLAVFAPSAFTGDRVNPAGTATGPFVLTTTTGDTAASLDRFDGYWGGRAHASGVDVRYISDGTARANALRTGEVDVAEAVPVAQVPALDPDTVHEINTARNTSLYLNTSTGLFTDPGLRAAAREAIDTAAVADGVYEGYAEPAQGLYGPALSWAAGLRGAPTGRTADPAEPDGAALTLATYNDRPELPETAQVVQQQLERAGFTVRLEVRGYAQLESDLLAGAFDAAVLSRNMMLETGDPVTVLASGYTCEGSFNPALLCDPAVDALTEAARAEAGPAQRQQAAIRAEAAVLGTDAEIPLVHLKVVTGIRPGVTGVVLDPYERELVGAGTRR
ncbi:ABC transporter substrate-binding protein [Streptomyces carpaticus]|uniref:ABC transporter substrate-binding protein n=1 Tax=Streptomyces cheonanensis TaxID=312720 RepID=A0ABN2V7H4_9ACTN|nr:ABC transporter substrate-binding protein [Streptomyces ginkgonis]UWM51304.1 ABC transporter substrate-binding protein [Streptomyces carpaticus]